MSGAGYDIRTKAGRVKRKVLADVIRRVVEAAQPDKIILFGSAARAEIGPNSDLDLLVIKRRFSSTAARASHISTTLGETSMSFQGHVEKGMVVLDQPLPLPDGTPVRVGAITPVPTDFWQSSSLDELAQRQGVSAPGSLEDLLGGWPMDELHDDFEETFLAWRERELEQHP